MALKTMPVTVLLAAMGLLAASGCSSDKPKDGPGTDGKKAPVSKGATPATAAPVAKAIEAPDSVLLYGGLNNANATAQAVSGLAKQVMPEAPPLDQMIGPVVQQEFKLTDAKVLDLTKAVRFAVFDHKQFGRAPEALMVGITSPEAFAGALPAAGKKKDDQGNAWSYLKYEGARQPVFVNFTDGFAVITRNKDLFPKHKAFFDALGKATLPEQGAVHVEMEHVMALRGDLFKRNLADLRATMAQAGNAAQMGNQMDTVKTMIDWVEGAAQDVAQASLILILRPDGLKLDMRVVPKDGSALRKTLGAFKSSGRTALISKLPANAPFFAAFDFDTSKPNNLFDTFNTAFVVKPIFGGDAAKAKPYTDAMDAYIKGMDGQMVMGAMPAATGMQMLSLFGVKDAKGLRAAQRTMATLYTNPDAKAYYDKMGIKMQMQQGAYTVAGVPVDITRTTMTNLPPEAQGMMGLVGDFMVQHIAIGDDLGVMAYGEAGKAQIEAQLNKKAPGGLDAQASVKRAIKEAAPGFGMLAWVNPIALAKGVKLGGMNPMATMLADINSTSGLAVSAGISNGGVQMVIDVPIALVKDGFAVFQKTKGAF